MQLFHWLLYKYPRTVHAWQINRGYLLFLGEYQIYFIECVENIRIFRSAQYSSVKILMFSTHEMKYIWYICIYRKSKFSFYFILFIGYMQCLTHCKRRCRKCKKKKKNLANPNNNYFGTKTFVTF